ncbi:hypothetical protein CPB97_010969 [Podila verticillata]|nr:hypothetical protein CPB97_010969 [Podila verticillata]
MSQFEKLPSFGPYSPVETRNPTPSPRLHRFFVLATYFIYVVIDIVGSSLEYFINRRTVFLFLFYADVFAALCFFAYVLDRSPSLRAHRLLSYYFFLVGWAFPLLLPLWRYALDWTRTRRAGLEFNFGRLGHHVAYCHEVHYDQEEFGQLLGGIPFTGQMIYWCEKPYVYSKVMVNVLSVGLAVHLVMVYYARKV